MPHVVFVAPRFLENTNRYVRAFAALEGVTLSVVSADPESAIPEELRARIAGHYAVPNVVDGEQLTAAVRAIGRGVGRVDRLAGALEQLQTPMAQARDVLGIEGINSAVARNFRDKDRMKEVLRAHGVPVARSVLVRSLRELALFVGHVGYPVIVKPQAGLGSRATFRVESPEDIAALASKGALPTDAQPLQVEEFVRAREHTCETVTVRGVPVWRSGTRYFPTPLEVLETPWVQYCVLLPRDAHEEPWAGFAPTNAAALAALFGEHAGSAAGTALTHMEWFLREDGTALVNEVGARPPGVHIMPMMGLAHETDMVRDWAELIAFDRFAPKARRWAAGAAFFRGQGRGTRVVSVQGVEDAVAAAGDALVEMRAPKVGAARAEGYEGEGWAIVKHATTEGAKRALKALIEHVQVRYG
ncbi:MAG: ATP-grasp domain-containing protein [Deltaproteobacteria bacterium]|nr:ATP-grasp domain-containing protein [Deltaproteobacteria bacterium]